MSRTVTKAVLLAAALTAGTLAAGPAQAAPPPCRVTNGSTGFTALQPAIDAAAAGDRLVISGTCSGPFAVTKDLTLAGSAPGPDRPVLTGNNASRVLGVGAPATLVLTDVIVRNGYAASFGGGGINNSGTLRATRVLVTQNRAAGAGGGILNLGDMVLTRSLVSNNRSGFDGGGIFNAGDLITWSTNITGNSTVGVGGGMFAEGVATMHGGQVSGNSATDAGGGILTVNVLVLDGTQVFGNTPDDCVC
jgi:nitrous oxidase accessory protein NosD